MKFLISSITDVIVEVVDITYCRNYSGYLVTTLFCVLCSRIPGNMDMTDEEFNKYKKRSTNSIRKSDSYLHKLTHSECAIEVRGGDYCAIKNRWGYSDTKAVIYID